MAMSVIVFAILSSELKCVFLCNCDRCLMLWLSMRTIDDGDQSAREAAV